MNVGDKYDVRPLSHAFQFATRQEPRTYLWLCARALVDYRIAAIPKSLSIYHVQWCSCQKQLKQYCLPWISPSITSCLQTSRSIWCAYALYTWLCACTAQCTCTCTYDRTTERVATNSDLLWALYTAWALYDLSLYTPTLNFTLLPLFYRHATSHTRLSFFLNLHHFILYCLRFTDLFVFYCLE